MSGCLVICCTLVCKYIEVCASLCISTTAWVSIDVKATLKMMTIVIVMAVVAMVLVIRQGPLLYAYHLFLPRHTDEREKEIERERKK